MHGIAYPVMRVIIICQALMLAPHALMGARPINITAASALARLALRARQENLDNQTPALAPQIVIARSVTPLPTLPLSNAPLVPMKQF